MRVTRRQERRAESHDWKSGQMAGDSPEGNQEAEPMAELLGKLTTCHQRWMDCIALDMTWRPEKWPKSLSRMVNGLQDRGLRSGTESGGLKFGGLKTGK